MLNQLFAVSGTVKALDNEIDPFMAVFMGTITGVGGGSVRDVLLARVPAILQVEVYAVAAMAGVAIVAAGIVAGGSRARMMVLSGSVCFGLQMVAYWQHWNLPTATGL
ncbi:MAG: TRIC cation channel family protein [Gemmatimonadaceae bacterium]|nr:TRIC cation channel family protein [Gloeobacterales cyanobacterium ES-bin-141]